MLTRINAGVVVLLALSAASCETNGSRRKKAQADVAALRAALDDFNKKEGRYPDKLVELSMTHVLSSVPRDPWGNEYRLLFDRGQPLVVCLGADGALGGTDAAADIRSNKP